MMATGTMSSDEEYYGMDSKRRSSLPSPLPPETEHQLSAMLDSGNNFDAERGGSSVRMVLMDHSVAKDVANEDEGVQTVLYSDVALLPAGCL